MLPAIADGDIDLGQDEMIDEVTRAADWGLLRGPVRGVRAHDGADGQTRRGRLHGIDEVSGARTDHRRFRALRAELERRVR
jgi:hypothetical protein